MLGAVLITLLSVALSTVTDAWQLYSGLLFVAMVIWAPGGLAGILTAHAPIVRHGRLGPLLPSYAAALPGLLLALAGVIGLSELAFRLQAVRNGAAPRPLLGLAADPLAAWPWLIAAALLAGGALLLRRTGPGARAAWQAAAQGVAKARSKVRNRRDGPVPDRQRAAEGVRPHRASSRASTSPSDPANATR